MIWGQTFGHEGWKAGKNNRNQRPARLDVPTQKNFFRRHALVRATTYVEKHGRTSSNDMVRERLQTAGLWSALDRFQSSSHYHCLALRCLSRTLTPLLAGLQQARCGRLDNSVMTAQ